MPPRPQDRAALLDGAVRALVDGGLIAVAVVRARGIELASPALERIFGLSPGSGAGRPFLDLVAEPDRARLGDLLDGAAAARLPVTFEGVRADGVPFEGEMVSLSAELGGASASVLLVSDVTERRRAEAQLAALAFTDPLTGLANRAALLDRLRHLLADCRRAERRFAILGIDLDGFKEVNDRHGHEAGDLVLQTVARRLVACVREADTVARVGGDEFTVLLARVGKRDDAALVADRMIRALGQPVAIPGGSCTIGASIGIVSHPEDGASFDALLTTVDAAMYESKRGGKNRYSFSSAPGVAPQPRQPPFLVWSSAHVLDHPSIDEQHREIVERVNCLGDALKAGRGPVELSAICAAVLSCTAAHFAYEERLMAEVPPRPSFERHVRLHRALLDDLRSLALHVDEASMMLTMHSLQEWLFRHVDTADRELAEVLAAAGVTDLAPHAA